MPLIFDEIDEFKKDFKKLLKRFETLDEDFSIFKQFALSTYHINWINNWWFFPITWQWVHDYTFCPIKVKKFACKSLKWKWARSGIRIIYNFSKKNNKITFIQIYFKEKADTDYNYQRIKHFYKLMK